MLVGGMRARQSSIESIQWDNSQDSHVGYKRFEIYAAKIAIQDLISRIQTGTPFKWFAISVCGQLSGYHSDQRRIFSATKSLPALSWLWGEAQRLSWSTKVSNLDTYNYEEKCKMYWKAWCLAGSSVCERILCSIISFYTISPTFNLRSMGSRIGWSSRAWGKRDRIAYASNGKKGRFPSEGPTPWSPRSVMRSVNAVVERRRRMTNATSCS